MVPLCSLLPLAEIAALAFRRPNHVAPVAIKLETHRTMTKVGSMTGTITSIDQVKLTETLLQQLERLTERAAEGIASLFRSEVARCPDAGLCLEWH
jgi:hypothetical protein